LAVCGRDFDVEAPQDRVLSDVEFVAIVALKAAQATIVATRCDLKHLLLFLIGKIHVTFMSEPNLMLLICELRHTQ
jgi:hypothetical protein